ncbi:MAG: hypothetical protein P8P98_01335, partial [Emcibacteraceae bacterium]|nr:hypothetical protein [Emcibacteraceae bacterium]
MMLGLNRLKSFFTDNDNDHELNIYDHLRGKPESISSEYHLKNVSSLEFSEDQTVSSVPSPVHERLVYDEERLAELMDENEKKAIETLKVVESLNCTSKTSWM